MKKTYINPTMLVVEIEQPLLLVVSNDGYDKKDGKSIDVYQGDPNDPDEDNDTLNDDDEVW